jgi:hypothetical protein
MDDIVIRSMLKWPDVPDVYGWLQLDRRGSWRIRAGSSGAEPRFEPIANTALREFMGRNYSADSRGCWFFQNGPQRVFVTLAYAPFVFRLEKDGVLADHCGRVLGDPDGAWLDEEGSLILSVADYVGLLDDRDLGIVADTLARGEFRAAGKSIPVGEVGSREVEARFGFVREPKPAE